jgi:hypothetical protein
MNPSFSAILVISRTGPIPAETVVAFLQESFIQQMSQARKLKFRFLTGRSYRLKDKAGGKNSKKDKQNNDSEARKNK